MDQLGTIHPKTLVVTACDYVGTHRYLSPLRYPGGKARLADYMKIVVDMNGLTDGHYVEPYAGGAGVALALLVGEYVSHIHINDIDRSVHAFWHCALNEPEALCRRIIDTPVSVKEWRRQRAVQSARHPSPLDLGFSTFFLNRTNRSGVISSGGIVGGLRQSGKWRLDARYAKRALVARIMLIASYRDRISLYHEDALTLLKALWPGLPKNSMTYLDPPYYVKGRRRLYANGYSDEDHRAIARFLASATKPWVMTYDDVPDVRALYRGVRCRRYTLRYTAHDQYRGTEVMFFGRGLKAPPLPAL